MICIQGICKKMIRIGKIQRVRSFLILLMLMLIFIPASAGAWTTEAVDAPKLFSNFYSRAMARMACIMLIITAAAGSMRRWIPPGASGSLPP